MSSKWRKLKMALRFKLRLSTPPAARGGDSAASGRISDDGLLSASSRLIKLTRSFSRSSTSKKICSICLAAMKPGDGHAIFTAECSHSFHFHCIASNIKHGNQVCPICRAKWKEIPFEGPILDPSLRGIQRAIRPLDSALMTVIRRIPTPPLPNTTRNVIPLHPQAPEPAVFNDDECLDHQAQLTSPVSLDTPKAADNLSTGKVKIETFPEVPEVSLLSSHDNFTVLIHLKAPVSLGPEENTRLPQNLETTRAAVDLVTVLDISGSMAGTKLALLKRAMGFVIQNLGPRDRLSVIAFSSTARRLFPLQRMSETGKQESLLAINSLTANGGTNIAEGLRKGAKVMEDRREKNSVASIILLSDGQDTYTVRSSGGTSTESNYHLLLPLSIYGNDSSASKIPIHAFGFGMDHDALSMHSISDISGGTFSFIETEAEIQDAFAQCIGGLLSVVAKDLQVRIECAQPSLSLNFLRAGSYPNRVSIDRQTGFIDVGDLYADEERDFLVSVTIPAEIMSLLKVRCVYSDPMKKKAVTVDGEEVRIRRPKAVQQEMVVSIAVDRQRNRLEAAEAMARAKTVAEQGDLGGAAGILESCRTALSKSASAKSKDELCIALDAELKEMQERLASRHVYEASGRAYILSGLSSHSCQRATARGDSTQCSSLLQSYQTRSMAEMLNRSQTSTLLASPSSAQTPLLSPKGR